MQFTSRPSLVNIKNLARSVRSILGYIEVAEPEYALSFFKLALVFEIVSAKIFSEKLLSTVYNSIMNMNPIMMQQL